jgi:hypothetical protein
MFTVLPLKKKKSTQLPIIYTSASFEKEHDLRWLQEISMIRIQINQEIIFFKLTKGKKN